MKKTWKLASIAFALFAFTACGNEEATVTEEEPIDATEEVETDIESEVETQPDTAVLEDTPVNDGVTDEVEGEQPIEGY
ncbi:hypothetical protein CLV24_12865 [Pontibacter ummariensis]|uniref:Uncharacterized protein n=1 Tax=Pontibacter ummariensis TaxID=1610492 RepID=A0A239KAV9_9BACT|nr:hypothetical protein [Pontibacter ummariensis]PRY06083.1 hypothetical protein CLV24_12865 [Pontibacter ummariensis]SNT15141.1 hypothetical protein SAMN06296052_12765 [Pontibacter ummariensis]